MRLLFVALAVSLAPGQDKIALKFNPKKGDKLVKIERSEMSIKATIVAGEQEQSIDFAQRESQRSSMEFLEVADGAVTRAVFKCAEDYEEKKSPASPDWEKSERPLHGRVITMSRKDGKLLREGADGLNEKILRKLDLDDRTSRIFPKSPVGPGDSWDVTGDDVRAFIAADDDLKEAKIKVKLTEVKDVDGRRCAILKVDMDLLGKAPNDVDMTIKVGAEAVIWIERGYALSVKGKGTIAMKAENAQFKMKGEGPMSLEITATPE